MREIKGRYWDIHTKTFIYFGGVPQFDDTANTVTFKCGPVLGEKDPDGNRFVFSEFTGLRDKNSLEIYEGDIIDWDGSNIVVKYGIQNVDAFEGVGFNLWSFYDDYKDIGKAVRLQSEMEIIGNIYENPELLDA